MHFDDRITMILELEIPDCLVGRVKGDANSAIRAILEGYAVQAHVETRLTKPEIRELLGLASDLEVAKLLAAHGKWGPTSKAEVEMEMASFRKFQEGRVKAESP